MTEKWSKELQILLSSLKSRHSGLTYSWTLLYVLACGSGLYLPEPAGQGKQGPSIFSPSSLYGSSNWGMLLERVLFSNQWEKWEELGVFNVKQETKRGIKAPTAHSPRHFYPMQLFTGRNQTQILVEKGIGNKIKRSLEEESNISPYSMLGKHSFSHTQFWSVLLFTSNWQRKKTWAAPAKESTRVP